ncbi:MAG: hypothetical protein AAF217_04650 [Pseudomonadota bacterium]
MEWLDSLLAGENGSATQLVLVTLGLVIGLILIVWIFRKIAGSPARRAGRNRIPRLSVTDSAAVDDKRYVVLVRRDNVEHLVMIGGPTDVVVESNIIRVQPTSQPANVTTAPAEPQPVANTAVKTSEATSKVTERTPTRDNDVAIEEPKPSSAKQPIAAVAATTAAVLSPILDSEKTSELETTDEVSEVEIAEALISDTPAEEAVSEVEVAAADTNLVSEESVQAAIDDAVESVDLTEDIASDEIEDAITQELDSALSSATFEMPTPVAEEQPEASDKEDGVDSEMKRLLEELSKPPKETA